MKLAGGCLLGWIRVFEGLDDIADIYGEIARVALVILHDDIVVQGFL